MRRGLWSLVVMSAVACSGGDKSDEAAEADADADTDTDSDTDTDTDTDTDSDTDTDTDTDSDTDTDTDTDTATGTTGDTGPIDLRPPVACEPVYASCTSVTEWSILPTDDTTTYNACGQPAESVERDASGLVVDRAVFTYDALGYLVLVEGDEDDDGVDSVRSYTYDDAGRLIGWERDDGPNGTVDASEEHQYNVDGLLEETLETASWGVARSRFFYDVAGLLDRWEYDLDDDGVDTEYVYQYYGLIVRVNEDGFPIDGNYSGSVWSTYDADGHLLEEFSQSDGSGETVVVLSYDAEWRILAVEYDLGNDGVIDMDVTTAWTCP